MLDRTPPSARHGGFGKSIFDAVVRSAVGNEGSSGKLRLFRTLFAFGIPHGFNGGGSLEMLPSGQVAFFIEGARKMMIGRRTVEAMLHVVLARPQNHDGLTGSLGHLCGFHYEIRLVAPAKTAAHQCGVYVDFLRREFGDSRDDLLRPLRRLRRR